MRRPEEYKMVAGDKVALLKNIEGGIKIQPSKV
jgi:hypothetical protein